MSLALAQLSARLWMSAAPVDIGLRPAGVGWSAWQCRADACSPVGLACHGTGCTAAGR